MNVRVFAYGVLGLPLAFAALPVYVHIPRYYAEVTGMNLSVLGAILLCCRLLDALIDPWLGWMADRLPRRPMIALALVPFSAGFIALLNPPTQFAAPWLVLSLALTYIGYSAASIAYQAWGAAVAHDSTGRTHLTAAREGFSLAGIVLAAALPGLLGNDLTSGVERLSWIWPPLLLAAAATTFCVVTADPVHCGAREPLLGSLQRALGQRAFRRLLGVFIANGISSALPATLFLFFVADVLGAPSTSGGLLALYFVAGAASLPAWVRIAGYIGRVRAWGSAMLLAIVTFIGAGLLGNGDVVPFTAICLLSGLALGADLAFPAAMAADLGERQSQSGAYFGVWNFVTKLNLALAAGLALPMLGYFGYQPGETDRLDGLVFAYALLPLAFKLLAAGLLWIWRDSLEVRP